MINFFSFVKFKIMNIFTLIEPLSIWWPIKFNKHLSMIGPTFLQWTIFITFESNGQCSIGIFSIIFNQISVWKSLLLRIYILLCDTSKTDFLKAQVVSSSVWIINVILDRPRPRVIMDHTLRLLAFLLHYAN